MTKTEFNIICDRDSRESCLEVLKDSTDPIYAMAYQAYIDRKLLIQEIIRHEDN